MEKEILTCIGCPMDAPSVEMDERDHFRHRK